MKNRIDNQTKKVNIYHMVISALFTAILSILSQISIPTAPIPFTLSLFGLFLIGALLPTRLAFLSVITYILLGAFGLPVFAGFRGGLTTLIGPTGGFLMAYPLMAICTSKIAHKMKNQRILGLLLGMILSLMVCYLLGSMWFSYLMSCSPLYAITICVVPFLWFDLIKITLAILLSTLIKQRIPSSF